MRPSSKLLPVLLAAACTAEPPPKEPDPAPEVPRPAASPGSVLTGPPGSLGPAAFWLDAEPGPSRSQGSKEGNGAAAPLSLTASDGTGLRLVALEASGVVELPLAFTELRLTFENPEPRTLEGRFEITLPPSASISRFAMKIGEHWQEGEVVERQAARRAYEDFLHRRQDPALLEQEAGNRFSARVFPIPPNGKKELILSYSQELIQPEEPYIIPLVGLPELGRLHIRALVGSQAAGSASNLGGVARQQQVVEVRRTDWTPDEDFKVPPAKSQGPVGLRHENLVVVRVQPFSEARPDPVPSLLVLFDTSASRALGYAAQVERTAALLSALHRGSGAKTPVLVAAFDQEVVPIYEGPVSGFDAGALAARRPLGASDLEKALAWVARREGQRYPRVLLVSDGVSTAGTTEGDALLLQTRGLAQAGVERLDALTFGGLRDAALLSRLVTAGLDRSGVVVDGDRPLFELARRLGERTTAPVEVNIPGAEWVWPKTLERLQSGDSALIYADIPRDKAFSLRLGNASITDAQISSAERPLLERAWVKARIERILHQRDTLAAGDRDLRAALTAQVTELSVKHRVLGPTTALLVLETEADYAQHRIDRRGLADILTAGMAGLEVLKRTGPPPVSVVGKLEARGLSLEGLPGRSGAADVHVEPESLDSEDIVEPSAAPAPEPAAEAARMMAPRAPAPAQDSMAPASMPPARRREIAGPSDKRRAPPHAGAFAEVLALLKKKKAEAAELEALSWRDRAPGDVLALVALGEVFEARGDLLQAERAYGSLIDLYPSRADVRRFAGNRLDRIESDRAVRLAADTYEKAVAQRPDHPSGHRQLAFSRLKMGEHRLAFEGLVTALGTRFPSRFPGVDQILREDLGLVAAAWRAVAPGEADGIREKLRAAGGIEENGPSLRFVLTWETDANDVDFHIHDGKGGHAFYQTPELPQGGGRLYADVTTGYGPECFTVRRAARAYPYRIEAHYYSRGPMGYGMGKVQVIDHDGKGKLSFDERPFVVMADGAFVELGEVRRR